MVVNRIFVALLLAILLLVSGAVAAAPGDLDRTFSDDGKVITDVGGHDYGRGIDVAPSGKIIVAGDTRSTGAASGTYRFAVVRYRLSGALDDNFSGDGIRTVMVVPGSFHRAQAVVVDETGRILVAGSVDGDIAVIRLLPGGALDDSFSDDGRVVIDDGRIEEAHDLVVQPDGKIVIVGSSRPLSGQPGFDEWILARLNENGSLDSDSDTDPATSFGTDGIVDPDVGVGGRADALGVDLAPNGHVITVGLVGTETETRRDMAALRVNQEGERVASFGDDGLTYVDFFGGSNDEAHDVEVNLISGKIVMAGNGGLAVGIARLTPTGSLDESFGSDGRVTLSPGGRDNATGVIIQPNEKIVAAGTATILNGPEPNHDISGLMIFVTRLLSNGSRDGTFARNGVALTNVGRGHDTGAALVLHRGYPRPCRLRPYCARDDKVVVGGTAQGTRGAGVADFAAVRYRL